MTFFTDPTIAAYFAIGIYALLLACLALPMYLMFAD